MYRTTLTIFALQRKTLNYKRTQPQKFRSIIKKPDYAFAAAFIGLSIWGILMVYSGSVLVAVKQGQVPYYYAYKQALWVILGLIAAFVTYKIDYHKYAKLSPLMLAGSLFLMIIVLVININNPVKRWIHLGWFDLQPSELLKISFLIYLSSWLAKLHERPKTANKWAEFKIHFIHELGPFLAVLGIVCFLIVIQPDMDTTIMLGLTSFLVYVISGNDFLHFVGAAATGVVLAIITTITTLTAGYRMSRFTNYFDFWRTGDVPNRWSSGYQLMQILVAVASGGLFGVGFGESRQKFNYLGDTAFSDTIFAIIAEEFGLAGCIVIVCLFLFIFLKGYKIAQEAPDKLGSLLAISMVTWITIQAFLHIAANVALIPINGNTLPFLSYGGSSTLVNLAGMGIVLNISRHAVKTKVTDSRS